MLLTSSAVQFGRHGNGDVEVLSLGLGETIGAGDVVGDRQLGLSSSTQSVAGRVQVTLSNDDQYCQTTNGSRFGLAHAERASAVCVYLVDRDRQLRASLDLSNSICSESILGVLSDVDVAAQLRSAALIDNVCRDLCVTDQGGILLAGADAGAVPCKLSVDCFRGQYIMSSSKRTVALSSMSYL